MGRSTYAASWLRDFATLRTCIAVMTIASPVVIKLIFTMRPSVQLALSGQGWIDKPRKQEIGESAREQPGP